MADMLVELSISRYLWIFNWQIFIISSYVINIYNLFRPIINIMFHSDKVDKLYQQDPCPMRFGKVSQRFWQALGESERIINSLNTAHSTPTTHQDSPGETKVITCADCQHFLVKCSLAEAFLNGVCPSFELKNEE